MWDGLCVHLFCGSLMWTVFPYADSPVVIQTKIAVRATAFVLIHLVHYFTRGNLQGSNPRWENSHSGPLTFVKPLEPGTDDSTKYLK